MNIPVSEKLRNLKIFWNFSDANAAASRIMLPVKSQINSKLCKYKEEKFLLLSYGNATKKKMAMESGCYLKSMLIKYFGTLKVMPSTNYN